MHIGFGNSVKYISVTLFFAVYFLIGVSIYKDYGVSIDEHANAYRVMINGKCAYEHFPNVFRSLGIHIDPNVSRKISNLDDLGLGKYYGVGLYAPIAAVELITGFEMSWKNRLLLHHLYLFIVCFIAAIFFYKLLILLFGDWRLSLLGTFLLISTPRFFAEEFYNTKDMAFYATFIYAVYFCILFIKKQSILTSCLAGITLAISTNARTMGVILLLMVFGFSFLFLMHDRSKNKNRRILRGLFNICICCLSFATMFILITPGSWDAPLSYLSTAFREFSAFPWTGSILYLGENIRANNLPWHYIPVWIAITTPVLYLLLFCVGVCFMVKDIVSSLKYGIDGCFQYGRQNIILLWSVIIVFGSVAAIIILKSHLYDGWRHMYFIYPSFIIITTYGLSRAYRMIIHKRIFVIAAGGVLSISILMTLWWNIINHPYQNVYFNLFARRHVAENFERDYWYLSGKQGLEYLKTNVPAGCTYGVLHLPVMPSSELLSDEDRERYREVIPSYDADYVFQFYRAKAGNDPDVFFAREEVFTIMVDGFKILSICKTANSKEKLIPLDAIRSVESNYNNKDIEYLVDRKSNTRWTSAHEQKNDIWLHVELVKPTTINRVTVSSIISKGDYPRKIAIQYSQNGKDWNDVNIAQKTHTDFLFEPISCSYLKIKQIGSAGGRYWGVDELLLYHP